MTWNIVEHLCGRGFKNQAGLAKAAGVTQPAVSRWKDENNIPSARQRVLLANAGTFGVELSPADFFPPTASTERAA